LEIAIEYSHISVSVDDLSIKFHQRCKKLTLLFAITVSKFDKYGSEKGVIKL